ncbi:MAG: hypothetical protein GF401_03295 [Chitinivibrionales bacterium]|nr:hypothetical protein [Chitinivibrionales bacterium]
MHIFEVLMLICFGISWPISIFKALRTKEVRGKSWVFIAAVGFGYINGIIHKLVNSFDWVIWLYVFNLIMVTTDLLLYFRYQKLLEEITAPRLQKKNA